MSKVSINKSRKTILDIMKAKTNSEKLTMLTCYDAAFGRILNEVEIDMILVGDSLGNVMLGYENTLSVTMEDMLHHCRAVTRVMHKALICADMPFLSYNLSSEQALENAGRLISQGGAQAVKLEGGTAILPQVKKITEAGIPVMGHLGLTPQSVHMLGGYKVQGKSTEQAKILIEDAKRLEDSGVFCLVLEMVPRALAAEVSRALRVPTIGIGAGPECDGQVLVLHDMLGFDNEFNPKFLKKYADMNQQIRESVQNYCSDVKLNKFPDTTHSF